MTGSPRNITQLLKQWSGGDEEALGELVPIVYEELRKIAARYLRREHVGHTLQTTALVHEAYLRLLDQKNAQWQNRSQFFAIAARTMRRILVDHARSQQALKRGGKEQKVSLQEKTVFSSPRPSSLLALDDALTTLAQIDPRQSRIVELRFFGGLSLEETADVLEISPATVKREWNLAKAWLYREITGRE